ncbi:MAG: chorismate mutase, partial [Planctomycetes bacterium]|nr:chorismate mutase [Planctomycetota bacterium]
MNDNHTGAIEDARSEIDRVDHELIQLLARRMAAVRKIG